MMTDRPMTQHELTICADLEQRTIARIEGQNWTDEPLTEVEKDVIGMAVSSVFYDLSVRNNTLDVAQTLRALARKRIIRAFLFGMFCGAGVCGGAILSQVGL